MRKSTYGVIALSILAALVLSSCPGAQILAPHAVTGSGVQVIVDVGGGARALIDDNGVTSVYVTATDQSGQVVGSGELTKNVAREGWTGMLAVSEAGLMGFTATAKNADGSPLYTGVGGTTVTTAGGSVMIPMSQMTGLVGEWLFSGNANDTSGNGNDGTVNGATLTTDRLGNADAAYSFDGSSNILIGETVPAALQVQNEMTISAWIRVGQYPSSDPDAMGMIWGSQYNPTVSGASLWLDGRVDPNGQPAPVGHICFQFCNGTYHESNTDSVVPLGHWVHIVAVRKANQDAVIYYDGVSQPQTSAAWDGSVTYSGNGLAIGEQMDPSYPRHFNGLIDDVRVFGRALTADEVAALYHEDGWPIAVTRNGLVGEWLFSGNANDTSGKGNNGAVSGATPTTDRFGNTDAAYSFDGSSSMITATGLDVDTSAGGHNTVSFWMKTADTPYAPVFSWKDAGYDIDQGDGFFGFNTLKGDICGVVDPMAVGTWYHIVAEFYNGVPDSAHSKLFINGTEQGISLVEGSTQSSCSASNGITLGGMTESTYHFYGAIDDVRVYNRSLSADEVRALYLDGLN